MENVNQISTQIRKTLLEISRHLTKEDLDRLKFLAVDQFGSGELERIEKPLEFLSLVTEHSMSDDDSVRYTIRLLDGIYKPKLAGMLKKCMFYRLLFHYLDIRQEHKTLPCLCL